MTPPAQEGPRVNERIQARQVRLIDQNGDNLGVVELAEARQRSEKAGLDLVEISPNVQPPVCKILDYGRYKYEEQKRQATARARQKVADLNEIKIRPNIEQHDYEVKCRNIERILGRGDKVRLVVRFRGREITRPERGFEVIRRVLLDLDGKFRVEQEPSMEGRQIIMVLSQAGGGKSRKSVDEIIPLAMTRPRSERVPAPPPPSERGAAGHAGDAGIENVDESQSGASDL